MSTSDPKPIETPLTQLERALNYARTHVKNPETYRLTSRPSDEEASFLTEDTIVNEGTRRVSEYREYRQFLKDISELIPAARAAELDGIATKVEFKEFLLGDILAPILASPDADEKTKNEIRALIAAQEVQS